MGILEDSLPDLILSLKEKSTTENECSDKQRVYKRIKGRIVRFKDKDASQQPAGSRCFEGEVELCVTSWSIYIRQDRSSSSQESQIWIIQEGKREIENLRKLMGIRWHIKERIINNIEAFIENRSIMILNLQQTEIKGEYCNLLEKIKMIPAIVRDD